MTINDLPGDSRSLALDFAIGVELPWDEMRNVTIEKFQLLLEAHRDDTEVWLHRIQRQVQIDLELNDLLIPLFERYSVLELDKAILFLRGEGRERFETLMRERNAIWEVTPPRRTFRKGRALNTTVIP
jgi:hypothetical protein